MNVESQKDVIKDLPMENINLESFILQGKKRMRDPLF